MGFTVDIQDKYTIIKPLKERLGLVGVPQLKAEFVNLQAKGVKNLILDLSEIKDIDSSELSPILVGNRIFTKECGKFVVVGVNPHVMKLIQISQLDSTLDILQNVEEGVDAIFFDELEKELKGKKDS